MRRSPDGQERRHRTGRDEETGAEDERGAEVALGQAAQGAHPRLFDQLVDVLIDFDERGGRCLCLRHRIASYPRDAVSTRASVAFPRLVTLERGIDHPGRGNYAAGEATSASHLKRPRVRSRRRPRRLGHGRCAGRPPASAGICDATATQPFLPWLDPARYVLAPGGAIETGTNTWQLSGAAAIVPGNEPYKVHDLADDESLSLPPGSAALTRRVCLGLTDPTIRFFALNTGSPLATLKVEVLFRDGLGALLGRATIATLTAFPEWQPTAAIPVLANATVLAGTRWVQFRFTPNGTTAPGRSTTCTSIPGSRASPAGRHTTAPRVTELLNADPGAPTLGAARIVRALSRLHLFTSRARGHACAGRDNSERQAPDFGLANVISPRAPAGVPQTRRDRGRRETCVPVSVGLCASRARPGRRRRGAARPS